ncbi:MULTISPECIES: hypothetical protein [Enterococcus]|uniref:hypothetical protein n=1 Tax=Enterococcus TaxID=1350 RepID=UPI000352BB15|nr:hypothetical protein [Enterococcus entomosocium]EPH88064.1 hypothetical protein D922_04050 [Enterococcus faecalis 06-MB-DW-09]UOO46322.1 hypothetical protein LLW22_03770 [Enterococcus casseliflavus]
MSEKVITPEEFLTFFTSVEEEFLQGLEKLHHFRTTRLLDTLTKDPQLLAEDIEVILDSTIGELYELTRATEIILMKNYVHFKEATRTLIDEDTSNNKEDEL